MKSSKVASPGTLTSSVCERIRRDIVGGLLPAGEKLRIEALRERYSLGGSPIREALNRLSSEGLVMQQDQRGFGVLPVSAEDLVELTRTRMLLNELLLRESLTRGDESWEEGVILALHRLTRAPRYLKETPELPNPEWELRHRQFHLALVAACGSRWLVGFYETLFDLADRYRHLVAVVHHHTRDTEGEHRAIGDAAVNRNVEQTVSLVNMHISVTSDQVQKLGLQVTIPLSEID